jgi:hypothetical protein
MRRSFRRLPGIVAALALFSLAAGAGAQVTTTTGQTPSGSFYKFMVPDGWTPAKGLVIWNHGFSLSPITPTVDMGPLVDLQLAQGYAVAASSYSLIGWAVFQTVTDLEEMVDAFHDEVGIPNFVLIYGASLGGLVTVQAVEQAELGNVVGAMPICGALAGSRSWDGGVDLRLLWDEVCGSVPGAAIPGGAKGLAFPPDPNFTQVSLGLAINACTGLPLPAAQRTAEQQARLDRLLMLTGIPENFIITDMGFSTFGLFDLTYDPRKMNGAMAMDNSGVDYGDAAINTGIERAVADQAARQKLTNNYTPTGLVGDVKLVSIHTDKDGLVLVEQEADYRDKVPANRFSLGIISETTPTHCGFTSAELVSAWENLRGWVAGGNQPNAAVLQGVCQQIEGGGLAQGPCRYNPAFVIPSIDERIRLRDQCTPSSTVLCLNDQRFKVEVTWTDFQNQSGPGITVPQTVDTGAFYFFDASNLELVIKVLDGRQINGKFWVYYGSLTNVSFTMTITDTVTGVKKTYVNGSGQFASRGDVSAF